MRDLRLVELGALAAAVATRWPRLRRAPFETRERTRERQLDRLRRLVRHAYDRVPFYREKYDRAGVRPEDLRTVDDLARFPVVTKDEVIANYPEGMLAHGFTLDRLIVSRSSGSTGRVLDIAYDGDAMTTYILAGLRLYSMGFAYRAWHRQLYVYTSPYPLRSLLGLFPMRFVSTLAPTPEILDAIRRYRPHLLVCYPSHLRHLLDTARTLGTRLPSPRLVSVNSEMSTQRERDAMSAELGCPVLDEYSSEELTRIAAQCPHRTYHLFEDINYLEILDEAMRPTSGPGVVVGTNLHNRAMPMIRYLQNDAAMISDAWCACGRTFRALVGLEGRRNDSFTLPSGRVLSSGFLLDATYEVILTHRGAVRDFCLVQEARDSICLQIVPARDWSGALIPAISARFRSHFEPAVRFRIETVDECLKTSSGKRNPIINRCGAGAASPARPAS